MGNNEEIKARLRKVLEVKNSNVSKITEGEEVKRSTLSAQLNGNSAISAETIKLFLKKFKDLSAEWLLRGEGMMCCGSDPFSPNPENGLTTDSQRTHNGGTTEAERIKELEAMLAERDRVIAEQAVRLSRYENKQ